MDIRDLWNFSDPAATEQTFRATLEGETDRDTRLLLQTQIARTLGLQKKFPEALALLDEVDAAIVADPTVSNMVKSYAAMERGRARCDPGNVAPDHENSPNLRRSSKPGAGGHFQLPGPAFG